MNRERWCELILDISVTISLTGAVIAICMLATR